jgi:hypothetical protein
LLLAAVAVIALVLVVVGVFALRGTLTSRKPPHTSTSTHSAALQTPIGPVLLIKVVREPCRVFVKNAATGDVLQNDIASPPKGATLEFRESPLLVQISDPGCVSVYVHGQRRPPGPAGQQWVFTVQA